jgi:hypothetical protein
LKGVIWAENKYIRRFHVSEEIHNVVTAGEEEIISMIEIEEESVVMTETIIEGMKTKASQDVRDVLQELEKNYPGLTEGVAAALGAGTGAAGSLAALSSLGTVSGLSAAGISTGLAAAGALVGGGVLVGLGVLATPVAALGVFSYRLAKKRKKATHAAAVGLAAKKIYDVQARLSRHEDHFRDELAHIKSTLEALTTLKAA